MTQITEIARKMTTNALNNWCSTIAQERNNPDSVYINDFLNDTENAIRDELARRIANEPCEHVPY